MVAVPDTMLNLGFDRYTAQPAFLSPDALPGNVQMIGQGTLGKTVLMHHLATQLMQLGWSLCYISPLGDLDPLLRAVPKSRFQDVIVLSPFGDSVVPWNPLEGEVTGETVHLFESLLEESFMARSADLLSMSIFALQNVPNATFELITKVVNDDEWRRKKINPIITEPAAKHFWEKEYEEWIKERFRRQAVAGFNNKMRVFSTSHPLRDMLCAKGTFQVSDLFDGKILLCDTQRGRLGKTETILSSMILSKLTWAAMRIDKPFVVFYDNANFANATVLNAAAESNLGLVYAHQHGKQLEAPAAANTFIFQVNKPDAQYFEDLFPPWVQIRDLVNQKPYTCYAKTTLHTLWLETPAPMGFTPSKTKQRVLEQSRRLYSRKRTAIHEYLKSIL
jgi:hypothetical protein